jgi:hypothetical protein
MAVLPKGFSEQRASVDGVRINSKIGRRGAGHWLMEEAPDQVVPAIVAFLG